jgi:hypothetical protein
VARKWATAPMQDYREVAPLVGASSAMRSEMANPVRTRYARGTRLPPSTVALGKSLWAPVILFL